MALATTLFEATSDYMCVSPAPEGQDRATDFRIGWPGSRQAGLNVNARCGGRAVAQFNQNNK
jgi:hypothetical protein